MKRNKWREAQYNLVEWRNVWREMKSSVAEVNKALFMKWNQNLSKISKSALIPNEMHQI